jgi:hypothetical protein
MPENTARTRERGGQWRKGYCPNPGGRPKAVVDVQALAREHTAAAIQTLVEALRDPKLKVQAAQVLLDRAWGKPPQAVHTEGQTSIRFLHLVAAQAMSRELHAELGVTPASAEPPLTIDELAALPLPLE